MTTKLGRKKTMFSLLIIVILTCLLSLVNYPISSDWDLRYIHNPLLNSSQFTSHTSPIAHVRAGCISHWASRVSGWLLNRGMIASSPVTCMFPGSLLSWNQECVFCGGRCQSLRWARYLTFNFFRRIFSLIGSKAGSGPMFFVVYILTLEVRKFLNSCVIPTILELGWRNLDPDILIYWIISWLLLDSMPTDSWYI